MKQKQHNHNPIEYEKLTLWLAVKVFSFLFVIVSEKIQDKKCILPSGKFFLSGRCKSIKSVLLGVINGLFLCHIVDHLCPFTRFATSPRFDQ